MSNGVMCICLRSEDFELCIIKVNARLKQNYPHLNPHNPRDEEALAEAYRKVSADMFYESLKRPPSLKRPELACCFKRALRSLQGLRTPDSQQDDAHAFSAEEKETQNAD